MSTEKKTSPLQEFRDELGRTGVISDSFRSHLISHAHWVCSDAFQRGKNEAYESAAKFLEENIETMQAYADTCELRMDDQFEEHHEELRVAKIGQEDRIAALKEAVKVFRGRIRDPE